MNGFEDLYEAYFRPVYRYVLSLCQNTHLAEEVTQRAFWNAYRNFDSFRGQCDVSTWLCRIAKNEFLQIMRKKRPGAFGGGVSLLASQDPSPENVVAEKLQAERIQRLVHDLEEPYKEVFLLRVYGEFDYARIAALFGKSESWARVTYFRAKTKICQQIEKEDRHG